MAVFQVGPKTRAELEHKRDVAQDTADACERDGDAVTAKDWHDCVAAFDKALAHGAHCIIVKSADDAAQIAGEARNAASIASDDPTDASGRSLAAHLRNLEKDLSSEFALVLDRFDGYWPPPGPPPCLASMGCLCAGHARGNPATSPCDTNEEG